MELMKSERNVIPLSHLRELYREVTGTAPSCLDESLERITRFIHRHVLDIGTLKVADLEIHPFTLRWPELLWRIRLLFMDKKERSVVLYFVHHCKMAMQYHRSADIERMLITIFSGNRRERMPRNEQ